MLVLDESLPTRQWLLLRKRRIRFRVIGVEVGTAGTQDEDLRPQCSSPIMALDWGRQQRVLKLVQAVGVLDAAPLAVLQFE
jgi:hypothetical protein